MKTTMKLMMMAVLMVFVMTSVHAQDPFYLYKEGCKVTFVDKNSKGKITRYSTLTVTKVQGDVNNATVTYETMVMDNKKNPVLTKPMPQTYTIQNGDVVFDAKSLVNQISEGMDVTVTGTPFKLPADTKTGDTFGDYSISIKIAAIKTNSDITEQKIVAEETVEISGHSIPCVVLENMQVSKVIGIKQTAKVKSWYGRGVGVVKVETYNKKDKLMTVREIESIEGL